MSSYDLLAGVTPCKENPDLFSSSLLEGFDSVEFIESFPEAKNDANAISLAEARHEILRADAVAEAKSLCFSCPALAECAEWSATIESSKGPIFGIVAGMDVAERRRYRRKLDKLKKSDEV